MTAGVVGYWMKDYHKYGVDIGLGDPDFDLAENVKRIAKVPLLFEPGTNYEYSLGIDIAGRVVEVVSGKNFSEYLQDELFKPLGMNDTFFYPTPDKVERLSMIWESDGHQLSGNVMPHPYKNKKLYSAGTGIYSTTGDYFKLGQMLLNGGTYNGVKILSPQSVKEIRSNQIGDLSVKNFLFFQSGYDKYGLGCFINGKNSFRGEGSICVLGLGGKNFELNFERNFQIVITQTVLPPEPAWIVSEEVSRLVHEILK